MARTTVWLMVAGWGLVFTAGDLTADELGGASPPKPYTDARPTRNTDYKRWGQYAVKRLAVGDLAGAEEALRRLIPFSPEDDDLTLLLASVTAAAGDREEAESLVEAALAYGLPPERVVVGPEVIRGPLRGTAAYQRILESFRGRPIHGPMLGAVTDDSARVWLRTAEPTRVELSAVAIGSDGQGEADTERVGSSPIRVVGETTAATDRTAVLQLAGLEPNRRYRYRLSIGGEPSISGGEFRTFGPPGEATRFTLAFGGGAGYHPPQERVWETIRGRDPDAVLLLGDNVYSDDPETTQVQQYCYYRRQSRPEFRKLLATRPVYSIWDDHDFGTDDSWGGPDVETPAWKRTVWNTFRENWVNPGYGGGEALPGTWYDFSIGDVDFFMLDGRYYRTDSGRFGGQPAAQPTMLGPEQNRWLRERLLASRGTFKVIVSPVPWDFRAKAGTAGLDTWRGFAAERDALFRFLSDRQIDGVVLLSADRHRSDAWKIEREGDYPLYEFNSSRLTNDHQHPTMPEAIFSYNTKQSFGWVTFDTRGEEPSVRYEVISIDNEAVHELVVPLSELRSGR